MLATREGLTQLMGKNDDMHKLAPKDKYLAFEYLCALEMRAVHWSKIPKEIKAKYDLPPKQDYGVDAMTLDGKMTVQAKWRPASGYINFTEISTFYTLSHGIIGAKRLVLITSVECNAPKMAACLPIERMIIDPSLAKNWKMLTAAESKERILLFDALIKGSLSLRLVRPFLSIERLTERVKTKYPNKADLCDWMLREYRYSKERLTPAESRTPAESLTPVVVKDMFKSILNWD